MATISQIVAQIRTAIFGKDVRENIAQGIEKCYTDVSAGVTVANTAANNANTKAGLANTAATAANNAASAANTAAAQVDTKVSTATNKVVMVQASKPSEALNKIWIKPEATEYIIPTMDDVATVAETATYLGIPELVSEAS